MQYRAAIFLRVSTDPVIRLWSGVGKFDMPADNVETASDAIYDGFGLTGLPAVQQLINGVADRIDFMMTGVPKESAFLAELESGDVRGSEANLGFVRMDAAWQPVGSILWMWHGIADVVRVTRQTNQNGGATRTIGLSVGTANTARKRANFDTYTPLSQRRKSPTDAACDLVPRYTQGSVKLWA
jgi:hypothetical protein